MEGFCRYCHEMISIYSIRKCNHNNICHVCTIRQRVLNNNKRCLDCGVENEVIYCSNQRYEFNNCLKDMFLFELKGFDIFCDTPTVFNGIKQLLAHYCNYCKLQFYTIGDLNEHFKHEHHIQFCPLCMKFQHSFTFERTLYTPAELHQHLNQTNIETKALLHPVCSFCRNQFYNYEMLKEHELKCHSEYFGHSEMLETKKIFINPKDTQCLSTNVYQSGESFLNNIKDDVFINNDSFNQPFVGFEDEDEQYFIGNDNEKKLESEEISQLKKERADAKLIRQQKFKTHLENVFGTRINEWKEQCMCFRKGKEIPETFLDRMELLIQNENDRNIILREYIEIECDYRAKALLNNCIEIRTNEKVQIRKRNILKKRNWYEFESDVEKIQSDLKEGEDSLWLAKSVNIFN